MINIDFAKHKEHLDLVAKMFDKAGDEKRVAARRELLGMLAAAFHELGDEIGERYAVSAN